MSGQTESGPEIPIEARTIGCWVVLKDCAGTVQSAYQHFRLLMLVSSCSRAFFLAILFCYAGVFENLFLLGLFSIQEFHDDIFFYGIDVHDSVGFYIIDHYFIEDIHHILVSCFF